MAASRPLQLLILGAGESRGRGRQARESMAVASQGPTASSTLLGGASICPHCYFPSNSICMVSWLCPSLSMSAGSSPQLDPSCLCLEDPPHQRSYPQKLGSIQGCLSLSDFKAFFTFVTPTQL